MYRKIALLLIGILIGSTFTMYFQGRDIESREPERVIRVGALGAIYHEIYLIKGLGLDEYIPAEVEVKIYPHGTAMMTAFQAGELDIMYVGTVPAMNAFSAGAKIKVIAGTNLGGTSLVVNKSSGIKRLKDIKGKKILVPGPHNFQDVVLRAIILPRANLTEEDVIIEYEGDKGMMIHRLVSGEADAAIVWEPHVTRMLFDENMNRRENIEVLVPWNEIISEDPSKGYRYSSSCLVVGEEFLRENEDLVRAWVLIHALAIEYWKRNPKKASEIISREMERIAQVSISPEMVEEAFKRVRLSLDPAIDSMKLFSEKSHELGFSKEKVDVEKLYYPEIQREVERIMRELFHEQQ